MPLDVTEEDVFLVLLTRLLDAALVVYDRTDKRLLYLRARTTERVRGHDVFEQLRSLTAVRDRQHEALDVAVRRRLHAMGLHRLARLIKPDAEETGLSPERFEAAVLGAVRYRSRTPVVLDLAEQVMAAIEAARTAAKPE